MERLRVVGIFGSPRRGGNTDLLLEEALRGAEQEGGEVERLYLTDYIITPCKECHGCDQTGKCVVLDDMQKIYPKLLESNILILASPIFFYGVTGYTKAFIDRSQALWAKKYLLKNPSTEIKRKGFFISVGATKGPKVFEGAILTVKYFFDTLDAKYEGELVFRGIEGKGEILNHPEALQQAFEVGRRLILEMKKEINLFKGKGGAQ